MATDYRQYIVRPRDYRVCGSFCRSRSLTALTVVKTTSKVASS
jgi:hypothetical protein